MSAPISFPHDIKMPAKTQRAGVITANDLLAEDIYIIQTKTGPNTSAETTQSIYSYDKSNATIEETEAVLHRVNSDGTVESQTRMKRSDGLMQEVANVKPDSTTMSSFDGATAVSAKFDTQGLRWDNEEIAVYFGGDAFRIRFFNPDAECSSKSLRIQARDDSGVYITKLSVDNSN